MESPSRYYTPLIESLCAERQEEIFGTGAPLTEEIGKRWVCQQQLHDKTTNSNTQLHECFSLLAGYCQLAHPEANEADDADRIAAFVRGTYMGTGVGWRILSHLGGCAAIPSIALEKFEIELQADPSRTDNTHPRTEQQVARDLIDYFDQLLATQPTLHLKLELQTQHHTRLGDELFEWFKRGAAFGYPYMLSAYESVLRNPYNTTGLNARILRGNEYQPLPEQSQNLEEEHIQLLKDYS